jgi:hypothetical protein
MNTTNIVKGMFGILAIALIIYGFGFRSRYYLTAEADEDIQMGRYHLAFKKLEKVKNTRLPRTSREVSLHEYNLGVANVFLGDDKTAQENFKRPPRPQTRS